MVPAFRDSTEYRSLDDKQQSSPGLVFAAFARFFESLKFESEEWACCRVAIEHFACSADPEAQNLIVTEVLENLHRPLETVPLLAHCSRSLYNRWLSEP